MAVRWTQRELNTVIEQLVRESDPANLEELRGRGFLGMVTEAQEILPQDRRKNKPSLSTAKPALLKKFEQIIRKAGGLEKLKEKVRPRPVTARPPRRWSRQRAPRRARHGPLLRTRSPRRRLHPVPLPRRRWPRQILPPSHPWARGPHRSGRTPSTPWKRG